LLRFDGHVAQYLGDGLLVYFGYPTAHEDAAERAVRAGLGILEAIGRVNPDLQRDHRVRLAARIGIHTGLVVVGEVGAGDRLERLALGDTPNVAARLKDVAAPDTVVISRETNRLVEGYFDIRDLGTHQLKGTGQPTAIYQVLRERVARTRLDAAGSAALTPLAGREVAWAAGGSILPAPLLQQVLARADGNPLFIEELSKLVRESGLIREAELAGPLPSLAIPATLRGSLAARLDRLGDAKTIAQIGAVLGREFSYEMLMAVSEIDRQVLDQALSQLVKAELLYQSGLPPNSGYVFKHALIQEAAYDAILKSTRQDQHRRIAEVITGRFQDVIEKQPELIAHHYTEAGLYEQAISYWQKAGQRALGRAANMEAIAHLERGLKLAATLSAGTSRDKCELDLQMGLAPAYMAIKGWASLDVERTCRRARTLGELLGDF
jgi:hypothetical protein